MKINLNEELQNTPPENNSANGNESGNAESGSPSTDNDSNRADLEQYQARFRPSITADDINAIANLTKDQLQKLKQNIKFANHELILQKASVDGYICPKCGSGTGKNGTGLKVTELTDGFSFTCFAHNCFQHYGKDGELKAGTDFLGLVAELNGLDTRKRKDFRLTLAIAKKIVEHSYNQKFSDIKFDETKRRLKQSEYTQAQLDTIADEVKQSQINADKIADLSDEDKRGLTIETFKRHHVGLLFNWRHVKKPKDIPTTVFTLPINNQTFAAIRLLSERKKNPSLDKVLYVNKRIYCALDPDNFKTTNRIIIVEGEIDGLSISQATDYSETVIITGGTNAAVKVIGELIETYFNKLFNADERLNFLPIILMDNDSAGKDCADKLQKLFFGEGYPAFVGFIGEVGAEKVDANDILRQHGDAELKARIEQIIADAKVELSGLQDKVKNFQDAEKEKDGNTSSKVLADSTDSDIDDAAELIQGLTDEETVEWIKKKLEWEKSKGGKWRVSCTQQNLDLIFEHDPTIKNLVGYDEFFKQEVFLKSPFWKKNCIGEEWKNSDDSHLRNYIRRTYGNLKGNDTIFDTQVEYSRKNSFHPVKRYLESLHWDGTPRAETFFSKFLNVDDTPYTREITRKWLLGAVSRIYHEGCDFQFALVLHGKQGIGKGYCLRMLGKKWYVSLTDSLDDTHALDTIERAWIVEIPELAAGRKAEINAQKAFLSDNADTRRKAYARRAETTPRHCVFAISVNDEHFLRDLTGNRRFKILESHSKQNEIVEGLTEEYTDQVWAEVFYMYQELFKDGFNDQLLRLSREVDAQADAIAEKHIQDDGLQGEIESFLNTKILPPFIWEHLTKEERRRFTVNACIELKIQELNQRIRAKFGKRINSAQEQIDAIDSYIRENLNTTVAKIESNEQKKPGAIWNEQGAFYRLHGTEERQATCAAEIFNECFGNDKRKNTNRINEVLTTLNGWKREEKRIKNFSGVYGDQKNIFWRDKNAENPHHDTTFGDRVSSILDDENFPF